MALKGNVEPLDAALAKVGPAVPAMFGSGVCMMSVAHVSLIIVYVLCEGVTRPVQGRVVQAQLLFCLQHDTIAYAGCRRNEVTAHL